MKSKAAIAGHPIHPMVVPTAIGAFVLALLGDVLHSARPQDPYWYDFSYTCIGIGVLFAAIAAIPGAVDYLGVRMSAAAFRTATAHALLNVCAVMAYVTSFALRRNNAALEPQRWPAAFGFAVLGFAILAVSGWLGGKLAYEHRVGVAEPPVAPVASATAARNRVAS